MSKPLVRKQYNSVKRYQVSVRNIGLGLKRIDKLYDDHGLFMGRSLVSKSSTFLVTTTRL
jgi:hypothetical protein